MKSDNQFLVGLFLLIIGYILGLATDIVKRHLTPRARLAVLSYGDGQEIPDVEDNTLIIGNIGNSVCNDIVVNFDYAGHVAKEKFVILSRAEMEIMHETRMRYDGQQFDSVRGVRIPQLLPGQTVIMKYTERYSIGGNPLAIGAFPSWHVVSPSSSTDNLATKPKLAKKLFELAHQQYPYDFSDPDYSKPRPNEVLSEN